MTSQFRFAGDLTTAASTGSATSGNPQVASHVDERATLASKSTAEYVLASDSPVTVALDGLTEVNVLMVKCDAKVRLRLTSSDGTTQALPVDGFLLLLTRSVNITAIDLTRVTGVTTSVRLFLGENSA